MRTVIAFISVILLWTTTPLAIKWSAEGSDFIFGAAARMTIGTSCMLLLLICRRKTLPLHGKALLTYFTVAVQIYGAMMCVYWGAQFIPSGWVSVIFGLSPVITALFAALWLNERPVTLAKTCSYLLGVAGLWLMFKSALQLNIAAVFGIVGVLSAVSLQTASAVWVKRINASLPAYIQVTGGLLIALPAYLITWYYFSPVTLPVSLSAKTLASIIYLGTIATTLGFWMYYYLLIHLPATTVGLIPMITPVLALYLGHAINNEPFTLNIAIGTVLILSALLMHEFVDRFVNRKVIKSV